MLLLTLALGWGLRLGAERIPLYNGEVVDLEVVTSSAKGLDVRMRDGEIVRLRWDQVDRSYPQHPMHGRKYPSEAGVQGVSVGVEPSATCGGRTGISRLFWASPLCCYGYGFSAPAVWGSRASMGPTSNAG